MKISLLKIGIILSILGVIWISVEFLEGERISEQFLLESSDSHSLNLNFEGEGIGYYKIFMPEYLGYEIFVQILDNDKNIISEQTVHTKMSVGYFKFENSGKYTIKISNISKEQIDFQVEFGETNSQQMILPGIMVLVGAILIIVMSFLKLKSYKIEQPDENIS